MAKSNQCDKKHCDGVWPASSVLEHKLSSVGVERNFFNGDRHSCSLRLVSCAGFGGGDAASPITMNNLTVSRFVCHSPLQVALSPASGHVSPRRLSSNAIVV